MHQDTERKIYACEFYIYMSYIYVSLTSNVLKINVKYRDVEIIYHIWIRCNYYAARVRGHVSPAHAW
jgi:hypothetical protein